MEYKPHKNYSSRLYKRAKKVIGNYIVTFVKNRNSRKYKIMLDRNLPRSPKLTKMARSYLMTLR